MYDARIYIANNKTYQSKRQPLLWHIKDANQPSAGLRSYGREPRRGVEGNTPGLKFEPAFTKIDKLMRIDVLSQWGYNL